MTLEGALTPAEHQVLKGRAHRLRPVVWIADVPLAETVIAEVGRALAAHELIKLQTVGLDREARAQVLAELCARCDAQPVQHIGKVLVLFRKKPEPDRPVPKPAAKRGAARAKRTDRGDRGKRSPRPRRAN